MSRRNHDIAELRRLDVAHHLPAQSSYQLQQRNGGSRIIVRAEGSTIWDGDGNAILDGMAGLWCVDVGYGRAELAEVAREQMLELPYYNTFFRTATPPPIELAARIAGLLGGDLAHIFFNSSGSEANDTVFRLVRYYWSLKGRPERTVFISRRNAYHGSTVAGASLGGMAYMHAQGDLPIPGVEHVMQPYWFGDGFGEDPAVFGERAANAIEERILAIGPEKVAAFIGEPVQGAGGVIIPPDGYWTCVALVGEVRTLGLIGAVEIVAAPGTNRRFAAGGIAGAIVRDACIARGLMVRAVRDSIVMCPPLVMTHAEVDRMAAIIGSALDETRGTLAAMRAPPPADVLRGNAANRC